MQDGANLVEVQIIKARKHELLDHGNTVARQRGGKVGAFDHARCGKRWGWSGAYLMYKNAIAPGGGGAIAEGRTMCGFVC